VGHFICGTCGEGITHKGSDADQIQLSEEEGSLDNGYLDNFDNNFLNKYLKKI
jgi:hypothetical protein